MGLAFGIAVVLSFAVGYRVGKKNVRFHDIYELLKLDGVIK
mgnify:CR=1 FL=1